MSPEDQIDNQNLEADIVIIGGGGVGLPAALTAAELGVKKIIVLEKRFATGGNALRANGIFAAETRYQKEAGHNVSKHEMFKNAMEYHHCSRWNPKLHRAFINESARTIQWLEEKGLEFEIRPSEYGENTCWHWLKGVPFPNTLCSWAPVMRLLTSEAQKAGVQFLVRTSGKKILKNGNGEITGVIAATRNGKEFEIKTKSVILGTGGFVGNKELLKKYFPEFYADDYQHDSLASNTGDGVIMAEEAGADMVDFCTVMRHGGNPGTIVNYRHFMFGPEVIRVNRLGKRYVAEDLGPTGQDAQYEQPGKRMYDLFDDRIVQNIEDKNLPPQHPRIPTPPEKTRNFRQFVEKYAEEGEWVKIADNWDDIADWIGCDRKVLKATIDEYHFFCEQGYDDGFEKDPKFLKPLDNPPFYAKLSRAVLGGTWGPVRINENTEVLDKQGNPIPGFYAGGEVTTGWLSCAYGGPGMAATALGSSMWCGRTAAKNAAKYIQGK